MRVWIDLGNSPHVALFGEVVDELRQQGDDVFLTARDHAQTVASGTGALVGCRGRRWSEPDKSGRKGSRYRRSSS